MTIYHNHHIVPKHAGGTDNPSNIIRLTVEEHAIAHLELYQKFGKWQDLGAYKIISHNKDLDTSGKNHRMWGKKQPEETKRKISESQIGGKNHRWGKKFAEESLEKMSLAKQGENNHMWGKKHSEESKKKMRGPRPEYRRGRKEEGN